MGRSENIKYKYLLLKKNDTYYYKFYKNLKNISNDLGFISETALVSYFRHQRKMNDTNDDIKRKSTFKLKDYKLIKLNEPFKLIEEEKNDQLITIYNKRIEENVVKYYNNINSNNFIMIC